MIQSNPKQAVITALLKAGKPKLANAASRMTIAGKLDQAVAANIIQEAMPLFKGKATKQQLASWFKKSSWASMYKPQEFMRAVAQLTRANKLKKVGSKYQWHKQRAVERNPPKSKPTKAGRSIKAVTYKFDGETLTKKQILKKGKSVEVVFMGESTNPTFHVLMKGSGDSAKVFKITKDEFNKSKLKDTSTKNQKDRYFAWQISKLTKGLSMSDAIDYNMWVKSKKPSEEKKIEYLGRK